MRNQKSAFTLVELLVVIAIIGILVALLLPAIQAAREAARRTQCKSNLRNLALAAQNHHDTHKFFPGGGWGWEYVGDADLGFGARQPGGWVYSTLPYIEESNGYDLPRDGQPDVISRDQRAGASDLIQQPITIINCPSRRPAVAYPNTLGGKPPINHVFPDYGGKLDYAMNSGDQNCVACSTGPPWEQRGSWTGWCAIGRTGQADPSKAIAFGGLAMHSPLTNQTEFTGVGFERSEVAMRHVTDGTSKTYLIGEKYLNPNNYETGLDQADNETWCTGFNNDNYRSAFETPLQDEAGNNQFNRFGGSHAGGFQMAFCDGSVATVSYDIDLQVHRAGGNRKDGIVADDH